MKYKRNESYYVSISIHAAHMILVFQKYAKSCKILADTHRPDVGDTRIDNNMI